MFRLFSRRFGRKPAGLAPRLDVELPLLHSVLRHLPAGILYADRDARVTNANDAFLAMLGRSREDLERGELNWVELTPSGWEEADQRAVVELMANGACTPYEKELRRADGTRLAVLFGAALLPATGEIVGFVLDLTERKRAEGRVALLAEAGQVFSESLDPEETLRSLVELAVPRLGDYALVFEVQEGGMLRQVACRHADSAKEALLRTLGEMYQASPDNPASYLWRTVHTGRSELMSEIPPGVPEEVTRDQALLDIYERLSPISFLTVPMAARGETLGALFLCTAESCRRLGPADVELAEELAARATLAIDNARLYVRAEAASRAKDSFLAALSHELRTPLTPVLLRVAALAGAAEPGKLRDDLRMIQRNVELEAKLIDDLLDLTRITRGKLSLHFEIAGINEVLEHVVEICREEAEGKRIAIEIRTSAVEQHVWADPGRLRQVLWNLVKNAVKFTPTGGRIEIWTSNPEIGKIQVQVIDQGIGIEPEVLPRLFNAFEQGDPTVTRSFGGLGLGLAISKALVDQHGGSLAGVSAGRGQGATFTVTLATVAPPLPGEAAVGGDGAARSLRLLLVEDHEPTLEVMAALLEIAGHEVSTAIDLRSARAVAASRELDLVVSDLGLPDGTGFDLMRELRDRYGLKGIAVSGYGMEDDLRRSKEAGFAEHLVKPVDVEKLKAALARASVPSA
ncbi:MAG TPA: ATP-binding protein [Thermoanaerobaculia bacterium]|nr:ATP-binding protein [Thermoanaerobaculia bacterium]